MCDLDDLLVVFDDFSCIADVADNCDIDRLCPHIREAQETLLANKIGWGLLDDILEDTAATEYQDLLCGSTFEYCGKKQKHFGLKRVLVHYAYGLYKYSGNYVDTAYGTVYKSVQDSVPVDEKILERMRNEYFKLANEYWGYVEKYLCANKESFESFDACNCACECGKCGGGLEIGKARKNRVRTFRKFGNKKDMSKGCGCKGNCGCSSSSSGSTTIISTELPTTQPTTTGMWLNNGVLTFWDGTTNKIFDYNEGELLDAFGAPTGIDI